MTIELFKQAMSGANGPVLIEGFPRSIDNLATFEEQCGPCAALLFLDVPEETMQARCLYPSLPIPSPSPHPSALRRASTCVCPSL